MGTMAKSLPPEYATDLDDVFAFWICHFQEEANVIFFQISALFIRDSRHTHCSLCAPVTAHAKVQVPFAKLSRVDSASFGQICQFRRLNTHGLSPEKAIKLTWTIYFAIHAT